MANVCTVYNIDPKNAIVLQMAACCEVVLRAVVGLMSPIRVKCQLSMEHSTLGEKRQEEEL